MINITEYFRENIKKNEYYSYYFIGLAYDETIVDYTFFDDDELIQEFKKFMIKKTVEEITYRDDIRFILISFYLQDKGYFIEQFPEYLERPYAKAALPDLLFNKMNNYFESCNKLNKKELNKEKCKLINNLIFKKKKYDVPENIEDIFRNISTRRANFNNMSDDEKLKEICNCIEFLLKKNDRFQRVLYSENLDGIINDQKIVDYRKKLECFRHASEESIKEREKYNFSEKDIMIRYGLFIIETIENIKKYNY